MFRTRLAAACAALALSGPALAADHPDFNGTWTFVPAESRNLGMMAEASARSVVKQTRERLVVDDTSELGGRTYLEHTVYDLSGAPAPNTSPTMGPSLGRSRWDGDRLVTDWEREGALAGSVQHRIETRRLSPDRRTMIVESARPGKDPLVMVFERR